MVSDVYVYRKWEDIWLVCLTTAPRGKEGIESRFYKFITSDSYCLATTAAATTAAATTTAAAVAVNSNGSSSIIIIIIIIIKKKK